jgi:hypothetical protein
MEDLIRTDVLQESLSMNRIELVKQERVTLDGPLFMVRLKIVFEQGYRFFCSNGTPPYSWLVRSLGFREIIGPCADKRYGEFRVLTI